MTCMPVFTKDRGPSRPVRWETVWINKHMITTGRTRKRRPVGEVWKEKDGTYHVITLAKVGEQAAMEGPDAIQEHLDNIALSEYESKLVEAEKEIDKIIKATE